MLNFAIGVIGATGYIATPYRAEIRAANEGARIVALCARRRELLEAAAKEDGAEFITDDWRQVIEHPDVNFVIVATPDALHHEVVMACAAAGKHVVCEKPVAMNVREARRMWTAYRDAHLGLAYDSARDAGTQGFHKHGTQSSTSAAHGPHSDRCGPCHQSKRTRNRDSDRGQPRSPRDYRRSHSFATTRATKRAGGRSADQWASCIPPPPTRKWAVEFWDA